MFDPSSNTEAPQPCPHLGLASDPSTSCLFVIDSHRCFKRSMPEAMGASWQRSYCISGSFEMCPRFSLSDDPGASGRETAEEPSGNWLASLRGRWGGTDLPQLLGEVWTQPRQAVLIGVPVVLLAAFLLLWVLPQVAGSAGKEGGKPQTTPPSIVTPVIAASGSGAPVSVTTATATTTATAMPTAMSQGTATLAPSQAAASATSRPAASSPVPTQRPTSPAVSPTQVARTAVATQAASSATARPAITATPSLALTATPSPTRTTTMENGQRIYVVVSGDNLMRISGSFGVSVDAIVRANNLPDENAIRVGQRLVIP